MGLNLLECAETSKTILQIHEVVTMKVVSVITMEIPFLTVTKDRHVK
jgi:hypothetical protein